MNNIEGYILFFNNLDYFAFIYSYSSLNTINTSDS